MAYRTPGLGSSRPTPNEAFIGQPVNGAGMDSRDASQRRSQIRQNDAAAAFGASNETEAQRQARTGVDRGGTGYVSGQVAPGTYAPNAYGAPPQQPQQDINGTTGINPAINSAAGAFGATGQQAPVSDISTRQGALSTGPGSTVPGATQSPSGTRTGQSPIPTGGNASPTVNVLNRVSPGLGDSLDPGSNLLRPTQVDLSPTLQAQGAAFGTAGNLESERYNYRPGSAPAQDRVQLEREQEDAIRQRQLGSLDDLAAAARGEVPSAAEIQLRQQAARNNAATFGAARALGGRSAGGAGRAATLASADANIRTNADAATLRATEQANARNALVAALSGTRGQDIDVSQANANLGQAANANNLQAQTQANALAEQHRQALLEAQLNAMGIGTQAAGYTVGGAKANAESDNQLKGNILKGIGQAFGM